MDTNTANTPPPAVMMSIAEIAARDGVSKPTVSIKVKGLVADHGLMVDRDGRGRVAKVNVAQYDHLREKYGDAHRAQTEKKSEAPPPAAGNTPQPDSLN